MRIAAMEATPTAVVRATTSWDEFPNLWGPLLDEVWTFVRASGLPAGRNVMLYADDRPSVEVGVELDAELPAADRIVASELPAGDVATARVAALTAEDIAAGHAAVVEWCDARGLARTGVRWEVYGHGGDGVDVCWQLSASR